MAIAPFGLGQNQRGAKNFDESQGYDPSKTQYGGSETFASDERIRLLDEAKKADARKANALDPTQMRQSREGQSDALALMRARANNTDPNTSVSGKMMNAGLARVMSANQSAAAGARGPAGLALAQQQSAANTANAMQQTSADAGAAAAQEASQNLNAWSGAATNQRGQDFESANANAQLEARQRALNDARWQASEGLRAHVSDAALQGGIHQQQQQLEGSMAKEKMEQERAKGNAANEMSWFDKWTGAANNVLGAGAKVAGSDVRMKAGTTMLDGSAPPQLAPGTEDDENTKPKAKPAEPSALSRAFAGFREGLIPQQQPVYVVQPQPGTTMNSPVESKDFVSLPGSSGMGVETNPTAAPGPYGDAYMPLAAGGGMDVAGMGQHINALQEESRTQGQTMMSPVDSKDFEPMPTEGVEGHAMGMPRGERSALSRAIDDAHARDNAGAMQPGDIELDAPGPILTAAGDIHPEWKAAREKELKERRPSEDIELDPKDAPTVMELDDEGKEIRNPAMESYLASTAPAAYRYKPEYQGHPGSAPGVNVGPASAQAIRATPVGATMIEEDPDTGMLGINKDKALKTTMSATSYVNRKVDHLARALGVDKPKKKQQRPAPEPQRPEVVYERQRLPTEMVYSRDASGRIVAQEAPPYLQRDNLARAMGRR